MTAPITKKHSFFRDHIVFDLRKNTIAYRASRAERHPVIDGKQIIFGCSHNAKLDGNDVTIIRKINGVKTVEVFPDELDAAIQRGKEELLREYAVMCFEYKNVEESPLEYMRGVLKSFGLENEMKDHERLADEASKAYEEYAHKIVNAFIAHRGGFGSRLD